MTLVVAWRDPHTIRVAADSRISFRANPAVIDVAAKIVVLEVRIHGPALPGGTTPEWVQSRLLGLAVVGSGTTAATLQASLSTYLGSLSSVHRRIDMQAMARVVEQVFQHISREVCAAIAHQGLGEVLLIGQRDVTGRPRACRFEIQRLRDALRIHQTEILTATNREYFGAGRAAALAQGPGVAPFEVLKEVILDDAE